MLSHPVWVCGLKPDSASSTDVVRRHTLYGCVDWNWKSFSASSFCAVTPCMGVWIETSPRSPSWQPCTVTPCMGVWIETRRWRQTTWSWRVTPCMGVWIETEWYYLSSSATSRHTLYGCVDWNFSVLHTKIAEMGHTLYGCVDWNKLSETEMPKALRHTLYGCVDWNSTSSRWKTKQSRSHPVWVCGLKRHQCCTYCGMECHTLYGCVDWNTRDKPKS